MKWFLLSWMTTNAALFAWSLWIYLNAQVADEALGAMVPFFFGAVSGVVWLVVLIIWLIVRN